MEFMHLHPHAQMPDDDTTIDYRYDLLDRISVYRTNADYVSKSSVCKKLHEIAFNYCRCWFRVHIPMLSPGVLSDPAKYTTI